MTRKHFTAIALLSSLVAFGASSQAQTANPRMTATPKQATTTKAAAVQADVPAEFRAGIASMIGAKSALEKAGDKWGGHRVQAIHFIDEALKTVGQPQTANPTEMQSGPKDEPAAMESGISQLNNAQSEFEKSGNQWGGRRANALSLIGSAQKELQVGIEYAKSHGTY
jgi:hypothetical protein